MTTHRVPKDITGPYASRVDGVWANHTTPTGAWVRAWPARSDSGTLVLERSDDGWIDVPIPDKRPGSVSGASGRHATPRISFAVRDEWRQAAADAGMPLTRWLAEAADCYLRRKR